MPKRGQKGPRKHQKPPPPPKQEITRPVDEVKDPFHIPLPVHTRQAARRTDLFHYLLDLVHPDTVAVIIGYASQIEGKLNWSHDYDAGSWRDPHFNRLNDISHALMNLYDLKDLLLDIKPKDIGQIIYIREWRHAQNTPSARAMQQHTQDTPSARAMQQLLISLVGFHWEKCPSVIHIPHEVILSTSKSDSKSHGEYDQDSERFYLCVPSLSSVFIFTKCHRYTRTIRYPTAILAYAMCVDGDDIFFGHVDIGGEEPAMVVRIDANSGKENQRYQLVSTPRSIAVYGSELFVLTPCHGQIQIFDRISGKAGKPIQHGHSKGSGFLSRGSIRIVQHQLVLEAGEYRQRLQVFY